MTSIMITGASGFVGSALLRRLAGQRQPPRLVAALRSTPKSLPSNCSTFLTGDIGSDTRWNDSLSGIDVVVHAAGLVHQKHASSSQRSAQFQETNVKGTLNLAQHAIESGARRFIFISSVKVNGESTKARPFTADDLPAPVDPYGLSKLDAETRLLELGRKSGMEIVVLRPVLVYGPGVKANFRSLIEWIARGIPLPFKSIDNRRSFVGIDNLVDLIVRCIDHPNASNEVFLVSDGEDLSTPDLVGRLARSLSVSARLLPVPTSWLKAGARLTGRSDLFVRLCESLQIDISKTKRFLDWSPPVGLNDGLARTTSEFLDAR
jgi:UDP-glucose 4-epimerase